MQFKCTLSLVAVAVAALRCCAPLAAATSSSAPPQPAFVEPDGSIVSPNRYSASPVAAVPRSGSALPRRGADLYLLFARAVDVPTATTATSTSSSNATTNDIDITRLRVLEPGATMLSFVALEKEGDNSDGGDRSGYFRLRCALRQFGADADHVTLSLRLPDDSYVHFRYHIVASCAAAFPAAPPQPLRRAPRFGLPSPCVAAPIPAPTTTTTTSSSTSSTTNTTTATDDITEILSYPSCCPSFAAPMPGRSAFSVGGCAYCPLAAASGAATAASCTESSLASNVCLREAFQMSDVYARRSTGSGAAANSAPTGDNICITLNHTSPTPPPVARLLGVYLIPSFPLPWQLRAVPLSTTWEPAGDNDDFYDPYGYDGYGGGGYDGYGGDGYGGYGGYYDDEQNVLRPGDEFFVESGFASFCESPNASTPIISTVIPNITLLINNCGFALLGEGLPALLSLPPFASLERFAASEGAVAPAYLFNSFYYFTNDTYFNDDDGTFSLSGTLIATIDPSNYFTTDSIAAAAPSTSSPPLRTRNQRLLLQGTFARSSTTLAPSITSLSYTFGLQDKECAPGCSYRQIGNDFCEAPCKAADACNNDLPDCLMHMSTEPIEDDYDPWVSSPSRCFNGIHCAPQFVNNRLCEDYLTIDTNGWRDCYVAECMWDGLDCSHGFETTECAPGCEMYLVNDGICQSACNVAECLMDGADCIECSPGCPWHHRLFDDHCDSFCQTAECAYDPFDCDGLTSPDYDIANVPSENICVHHNQSLIYYYNQYEIVNVPLAKTVIIDINSPDEAQCVDAAGCGYNSPQSPPSFAQFTSTSATSPLCSASRYSFQCAVDANGHHILHDCLSQTAVQCVYLCEELSENGINQCALPSTMLHFGPSSASNTIPSPLLSSLFTFNDNDTFYAPISIHPRSVLNDRIEIVQGVTNGFLYKSITLNSNTKRSIAATTDFLSELQLIEDGDIITTPFILFYTPNSSSTLDTDELIIKLHSTSIVSPPITLHFLGRTSAPPDAFTASRTFYHHDDFNFNSTTTSSSTETPFTIVVEDPNDVMLSLATSSASNGFDLVQFVVIAGVIAAGLISFAAFICFACYVSRRRARLAVLRRNAEMASMLAAVPTDTPTPAMQRAAAERAAVDVQQVDGETTVDEDDEELAAARAKRRANPYYAPTTISQFSSEKLSERAPSQLPLDFHRNFVIKPRALHKKHKLGQGSFGFVYSGVWRGMDVAIKEVNTAAAEEAKKQLLGEIQLMQDLRPHQNVIRLFGICFEPLSIVTEFAERGSLDDLLRKSANSTSPTSPTAPQTSTTAASRISQRKERKFILGIAKGLKHLHREGVVHRDLAARNVLVNDEWEAKIADFGMARAHDAFKGGGGGAAQTLSKVGPIRWMAPEQLRSQRYSPASDVWAFGVTVFEIATHEKPWKEHRNTKVAQLVLNGDTLRAPRDAHRVLRALLPQCFAFNARDRPTMKEVVSMLSKEFDDDGYLKSELGAVENGEEESDDDDDYHFSRNRKRDAPEDRYGSTPSKYGSVGSSKSYSNSSVWKKKPSEKRRDQRGRVYDDYDDAPSRRSDRAASAAARSPREPEPEPAHSHRAPPFGYDSVGDIEGAAARPKRRKGAARDSGAAASPRGAKREAKSVSSRARRKNVANIYDML